MQRRPMRLFRENVGLSWFQATLAVGQLARREAEYFSRK
jgi:hypothetical protein